MHIEYKYRYRDYVLPDRPIVKYSEKVNLDRTELRRDEDTSSTTPADSSFSTIGLIKDTSAFDVRSPPVRQPIPIEPVRGRAVGADRPHVSGIVFLFSGQVPLDVPAIGSPVAIRSWIWTPRFQSPDEMSLFPTKWDYPRDFAVLLRYFRGNR